jgi:hypothetical protein
MTQPFEHLTVEADGQRVTIAFEAFAKLPLHQRVQYLMNRTAEFFNGQTQLDRREVLRTMMQTMQTP